MTPPLWVYKNNAKGHPNQAAFGGWDQFFAQAVDEPVEWGGSETMSSAMSLKILWEEMRVGDLASPFKWIVAKPSASCASPILKTTRLTVAVEVGTCGSK